MYKVTVIIPNYNGLRFMELCMPALAAQTFTSFELLIVDNGSSDGSVDYLRALEKTGLPLSDQRGVIPVRLLLLAENTGFSGAVNAGISHTGADYVLLLNNDTKAEPGFLKALVKVMDADLDHHIFAVSPKMVQLYHPDLLDDAGDGYNLLGWAFQRGVGQGIHTPRFNRGAYIFSACAGASLYRRAQLEAIRFPDSVLTFPLLDASVGPSGSVDSFGSVNLEGKTAARTSVPLSGIAASPAAPSPERRSNSANAGSPAKLVCGEYFDQQHFAYLEDVDVSYRAAIHGAKVYYCPEAVIHHVGSGTSGSKYNAFKVRLAARNNVYLNYKNMPLLQLLLNLPGIAAGVLIKAVFFWKKGFGKEYCNGFLEGVRTLPDCRKVKFRLAHLPHYIRIEWMLLCGTLSYAGDFLRRHLRKQ